MPPHLSVDDRPDGSSPVSEARLDAGYVLPLRWTTHELDDDLTAYLVRLSAWLSVTVVDGSPAEIWAEHHRQWSALVRHIGPGPWPGRNGKVAGGTSSGPGAHPRSDTSWSSGCARRTTASPSLHGWWPTRSGKACADPERRLSSWTGEKWRSG